MRLKILTAAFAVAMLPVGLVAQDRHEPNGPDHGQEHAEEHTEQHVDHGGPGPHFIDAFYVENAFLAKKEGQHHRGPGRPHGRSGREVPDLLSRRRGVRHRDPSGP